MLGRWKSEAYATYIKYSHQDIANLQNQLCHKKVINEKIIYTYDDDEKIQYRMEA